MANSAFSNTGGIGTQPATKAQQEAGSSNAVYTSPATQQNHPSANKGWAYYDTATGIGASYNVTSNTDNGTNNHTITWTVAFSSTNYCAVACPKADAADTAASSWSAQIANSNFNTTSTQIFTTNSNGNTSVGEVNHTFVVAQGAQ